MRDLIPDNCKLCRFVLQTGGDLAHVDAGDVMPVALVEDEHWIVALNENQATLGRIYLVLKRHEVDVTSMSECEQTSMWRWSASVKGALDKLFAPDHYNYMFHMNAVPHAHFHIYPRYREPRTFAGARFDDPQWGGHYDPAASRRLDADAQAAIAKALQAELSVGR